MYHHFSVVSRTWGCLRSNWSRAAKAKGGAVLVASLCGTLLHFLVESDGQGYRHGKPLSMAGKSSVMVFKGRHHQLNGLQYTIHAYIYIYIPSGYLTVRHGKSLFWSSVNHLFLWAIYTMAMRLITRGYRSWSVSSATGSHWHRMWVDHQEATVSYGGGNRGYVVGIRYQFLKYNFLILRSAAPLETSFQDFKKKTPEKKTEKKTLFQASALCKSVLKPSSWIHPSCPTLHQWITVMTKVRSRPKFPTGDGWF